MSYKSNPNHIDYTDDKVIASRLEKLNKFIEKNLQHLVSTHQIKTTGIDNNDTTNYDSIEENVKLGQVNSITNSTEILSNTEKELLYQVENSINMAKGNIDSINSTKSNITYLKEIKDLSMMIVNEIDTFEMPDQNKLLLLELIEKYETFIDKVVLKPDFDGKYYLEQIRNLCMNVSDLEDNNLIEDLTEKITNLDLYSDLFITDFEQVLYSF
jgi:hypothetical protein